LVCSQAVRAQETIDSNARRTDSTSIVPLSQSAKSHIIWHDLKESAYDGGQYVLRPLHWDLREWAIIATGLGITAMMELVDDPIARTFMQNNQGKVGDGLAWFGNKFYGNGIATVLAGGSLYAVGLETDNNKLRVMGRHVFQSFLYAGLTTTALKIILGRNRPFLNQGDLVYHGFSFSSVWNSLPSGHVTVATALSESLAADIDNPWASAALYTFAGVTVFSRLYSDQHWLSDTFLAAVIGSGAGYWVSKEEDHYDTKETGFMIVPGPTNLTLLWTF